MEIKQIGLCHTRISDICYTNGRMQRTPFSNGGYEECLKIDILWLIYHINKILIHMLPYKYIQIHNQLPLLSKWAMKDNNFLSCPITYKTLRNWIDDSLILNIFVFDTKLRS